jgi:serine/threonine protein kinase
MPLEAGGILRDRYRIKQFISRGGMGSIYLAEDIRLEGRLCAVKEVRLDSSLSEETLEQTRAQFLREATVLARLDHQNLPKVSDFFSEERLPRHGLHPRRRPALTNDAGPPAR